MLAPSPVVKKSARDALRGNYLKCVAINCVLIFSFFIFTLAESLVATVLGDVLCVIFSIAAWIFVLAPLSLGVCYFFRRLIWESGDSLLLIFKYFSSASEYKRALHLISILTLKLVYALAVLSLPCIIVWIFSSTWFYDLFNVSIPVWTSGLLSLNSFLVIIAAFLLCFFMLKYYVSIFLFVGNDTMHPAEAVNMSNVISRRTGGDFFGLVLSFSGWILLSLLVFPLAFTLPYFFASYCTHCRFAVTAYNMDVDVINSKDTPYYKVDET